MGREHYTLLKSSLSLGGFQLVVSFCSARFTSCHPICLRLGSWLNSSEKVPKKQQGIWFLSNGKQIWDREVTRMWSHTTDIHTGTGVKRHLVRQVGEGWTHCWEWIAGERSCPL